MYKLIGDSCTDVTEELLRSTNIHLVPLTIQIEEQVFIDDRTLQQSKLLEAMNASEKSLSTACPAPEAFMNLYAGEEDVYVITLSSKLSGSYNSAQVAKQMYLEENKEKNIAVIDSMSASVGQTLILLKVQELAEQGLPFEQVVAEVEQYRDSLQTKFVLESLENLRKNGRLSNVKAFIANTLNLKPVMKSNGHGEIEKMDQARGMKRALDVMISSIEKDVKEAEQKIFGIAHCNNLEKALYVKEEVLRRVKFKDVIVVGTSGISTAYACDGGIIVAY